MIGWSELIYGSMYCGKSEELLRRLKRAKIAGQKYQLFKPSVDDRYGINHVATHDNAEVKSNIRRILDFYVDEISDKRSFIKELTKQLSGAMNAIVVDNSTEILKLIERDVEVVGIDEIQFFDQGLIDVVTKLERMGIRVILAGLDMYANSKPFGDVVKHFACTAKYVDKLHAVCVDCGRDAYISFKLGDSDPTTIDVGSVGKYIALCENCAYKREKKL